MNDLELVLSAKCPVKSPVRPSIWHYITGEFNQACENCRNDAFFTICSIARTVVTASDYITTAGATRHRFLWRKRWNNWPFWDTFM